MYPIHNANLKINEGNIMNELSIKRKHWEIEGEMQTEPREQPPLKKGSSCSEVLEAISTCVSSTPIKDRVFEQIQIKARTQLKTFLDFIDQVSQLLKSETIEFRLNDLKKSLFESIEQANEVFELEKISEEKNVKLAKRLKDLTKEEFASLGCSLREQPEEFLSTFIIADLLQQRKQTKLLEEKNRNQAQYEIINQLIKLHAYSKAFRMIHDITDQDLKDQSLRNLFSTLIECREINLAIIYACGLADITIRNYAFQLIYQYLEKLDDDVDMGMSQELPSMDQVFYDLVDALIPPDDVAVYLYADKVDLAEKVAHFIEDKKAQAKAINRVKVAKVEILKLSNPENAEEIALSIEDEKKRNKALHSLCLTLVKKIKNDKDTMYVLKVINFITHQEMKEKILFSFFTNRLQKNDIVGAKQALIQDKDLPITSKELFVQMFEELAEKSILVAQEAADALASNVDRYAVAIKAINKAKGVFTRTPA